MTSATTDGEVVAEVLGELAAHPHLPDGPELDAMVGAMVDGRRPLLPPAERHQLVQTIRARVFGLGRLEPLLADPSTSDVLVNPDGSVWVEQQGELSRTAVELDEAERLSVIERIVLPLGLRIDRAQPVVDARLPDGSRVHAIIRPLAVDGPCLSIRRFGTEIRRLADYAAAPVVACLRRAVAQRMNVIVSGGTGAGKTSLLNALAAELPSTARIVTIEDAAELSLPGEHVVRLEARTANVEGVGRVTVRDLVRAALRMRPDRIVVGEVRGPEALDMVQAMNTGHEGSLSTCHANSPADALRRLETMVLMGPSAPPSAVVREQLRSSIDLVVQVARDVHGPGRRVVAVAEVVDADPAQASALRTRPLFDVDGEPQQPAQRPSRIPGSQTGPWWP